jgi:hypothetical protein
LGKPNRYTQAARDCRKFNRLFSGAELALVAGSGSRVFELSTIFLAVRNFATCYALGCMGVCEFSRFSARRLGDVSLLISDDAFSTLEKSRLLSTRGHGPMVARDEVAMVLKELPAIANWMDRLLKEL